MMTVAALLCASLGVQVAAQEQTRFCQRLRFKHEAGGTCTTLEDGKGMEFEFGRCGENKGEVIFNSLPWRCREDRKRRGGEA